MNRAQKTFIIITMIFTLPAYSQMAAFWNQKKVWTWLAGTSASISLGTYGTMGVGSTSNIPGARSSAATWIDSAGNLWLFGGSKDGSITNYNDLWKYTPSTGQWTWVTGSNTTGGVGVYGTLGTPAAANTPGARHQAFYWKDASDNLWLFGGRKTNLASFNDLWKFVPGTGQWTWMAGSNTTGAVGVYGTKGTGSTSNIPGSRYGGQSWVTSDNVFWLFAGSQTYAGSNDFNDLWSYSPATGQWTWVTGLSTFNGAATYGTKGVGSTSNTPDSRFIMSGWVDSNDVLWLFGGFKSTLHDLNDLWSYNKANGQWTWVSGANTVDQAATYGTAGVPSASNVIGARDASVAIMDKFGTAWVFGGINSVGNFDYNNFWSFNPVTVMWTWMQGSSANNVAGSGTLNVGKVTSIPDSRDGTNIWYNKNLGIIYIFGGSTYLRAANDFWMAK